MEEPFTLQFPPELMTEAEFYYECPEDFKFKIFNAKVVNMVLPQIDLLNQYHSGSSIYISLTHVQVNKSVETIIIVKKAFLAFIYVIDGEISFFMQGQKSRIFVQKGKYFMVYVPAGNYPASLLPGKSTAVFFVLRPTLMQKIIGDYPEFALIFQKLLTNDPAPELFHVGGISKPMLAQLLKLGAYKQQGMLRTESVILSLFNDLIEAQLRQFQIHHDSQAGRQEIALRVYEYIRIQAFIGPLNRIEKMADEFGIGYYTLLRVFKETFGLTLKEFVNREKMDAARYLLSKDGLSVTQVSERLGYNNPQSFSRLFKAYHGYSPSEIKHHL